MLSGGLESNRRTSAAFSARTEWERTPTPLAQRWAELRQTFAGPGAGVAGTPLIDLTESNPTHAGFEYPAEAVLAAIARPESLAYEPEARGLRGAREAIAARVRCDPSNIVLTASTSEGYAWLFKLLCEPGAGDEVLIPSPSYPLFDYIAQLEGVRVVRYPLTYDGGRWRLEVDELARLVSPRARALIIVQPNNPTGSALHPDEIDVLDRFCAERELAVVSDEVFADYPFDDEASIATFRRGDASQALTFVLGGLSKAAGLPQLKLSWIVTGGPHTASAEALERLEIIGDTFLSVGTPVQLGAGPLLAAGSDVCRRILARVRANRANAADACRRPGAAWDVLGAEGGWYAALRLPRVRTEEEWALGLLEEDHVYVHPGYLFDFDRDGYIVISLLPEEGAFAEGMRRIAARVAAIVG